MSKSIDIEDGRPVDYNDDAAAKTLQHERYGGQSEGGGVSLGAVIGIIGLVLLGCYLGSTMNKGADGGKKKSKSRGAEVEVPSSKKSSEPKGDSDDCKPQEEEEEESEPNWFE